MAKRKPRDVLAAAYQALNQELDVLDSRNLKPGELCRVLNSTPLGAVINDRQLRRHRTKAGFRFSDGKSIDLLRFVAWAFESRQPVPERPVLDEENPFVVPTRAIVCQFFGVSMNAVKDWVRQGMPYEAGAYDLSEIAKWHQQRARQPAVGESADKKRSLEVRKLEEEVRSRERDNLIEEGQLISRQSVENEVSSFLITIRKEIEQLPRLLQPMLPREHETRITAELTQLVHARLNGVADTMSALTRAIE